jgi:two-component system, response regulator FlrC
MSKSTVLIVEDDRPLQEALVTTLEGAGYDVLATASGADALKIVGQSPVDLVVTDVQMSPMNGHELLRRLATESPRLPVMMMTAYGTISQAVDAMRDGAVDYLVKPFEASELEARVARHMPRNHHARPIAADPRSCAMLELAEQVAVSDVTVLLRGESGTGKEVLARFIHSSSPRSAGPFVAINCAAIPEQMLEALLFGHEKGSFTGAEARSVGKFVQANGGTLLLDEVSEMDLGLQAKLLRVLQEKEVEPLGAKQAVALDVRVLATTNRDLEQMVKEGRFRADLYYRLNVFPLLVPPLRERPGDIEPLARAFIATAWQRSGAPPTLSESARRAIERCSWPGNVRQLQNAIQRALVLAKGPVLHVEQLSLEAPEAAQCEAGLNGELRMEEARLIVEALTQGKGSRKLAAERLGISARTLRYKLARLREAGVEIPAGRGS